MSKARPPYASEVRRQIVELVRAGRGPSAQSSGARSGADLALDRPFTGGCWNVSAAEILLRKLVDLAPGMTLVARPKASRLTPAPDLVSSGRAF